MDTNSKKLKLFEVHQIDSIQDMLLKAAEKYDQKIDCKKFILII